MKDQTSPNTMFHEKDMAVLMSLCVLEDFSAIRCEQKDLTLLYIATTPGRVLRFSTG
jgi:hypothetical protein